MSKFTLDQMVIIASSKLEVLELAENLSIKSARITDFLAAADGTIENFPIYQIDFWDVWQACNGDITSVMASLLCKNNKAEKSEDTRPISAGMLTLPEKNKLSGSRFVFTSAQNNTPVHAAFLASLLTYCNANDAQLVIGQFVYNKNGFQNGQTDDDGIWYDPAIKPYFLAEAANIVNGLDWCGELNILPSAKYPLSGLEQYTGTNSCVVPHAKIALESVATLKHQDAKLMYATGAITQHNYIQKKTGQLAEAEHCFGALVVEIAANGGWFCRQIQTDETGVFQDLTCVYTPEGVEGGAIAAINWGDLHSEKSDFGQIEICQNMLDDLRPKYQLFHDCFDMTSRNHHNRKSGHFLMGEHSTGSSVAGDLKECAKVLDMFSRDYCTGVVVESNHDLALESWLNCNEYDYRRDPLNALTFLSLQLAKYTAIAKGNNDFNLLDYSLGAIGGQNSEPKFLSIDDSFLIAGIECGIHGHIGANGSRGSPKQFRKLSVKVNTGHTHTASIHGGVYTAGVTGSMNMGYNVGASSWSHSHILTYANGQRAIITTRNGTYKA